MTASENNHPPEILLDEDTELTGPFSTEELEIYNPEITNIINENLRLSSAVAILINTFNTTGNIAHLTSAEEIQEQMEQNLQLTQVE